MPAPLPATCSSCGEPLAAPLQLTEDMASAALRGPRLTGRLDGKLSHFPLGAKTTLGRNPTNTLRLADREVSKEHATIERVGSTFILRDLSSSNGTFVNGRRIRELKLRDGDELTLGNSRLIFRGACQSAD